MKLNSSILGSPLLENFKIECKGLELSPNDYYHLKHKLTLLELRSPTVSQIHLEIENNDEIISGILTIKFQGKSFRSNASGNNARETYQKLEAVIDNQLLRWKRNRFNRRNDQDLEYSKLGGYAV